MYDITIQTQSELIKLIGSDGVINYNLTIRGSNIETLQGIIKINGNLTLSESSIRDLGELEEIGGTFHLGNYYTKSGIESFNKLLRIKGSLNFRYSSLKSLGSIIEIGGNLNLRDTECFELGNLKEVGGNILLPKLYYGKINLDNIHIRGQIKYWSNNQNKFVHSNKSLLLESELPIPFWQFKYLSDADDITDESVEIVKFYGWFKNKFQNDVYIDLKGNNNFIFYLMLEYKKEYFITKDLERLRIRFKNLSLYYPVVKPYTNSLLIDIFDGLQLYEDLYFEITNNKEYVNLSQFLYATFKSKKLEIDIEYLIKITSLDSLTDFGKKNLSEIIKFYSLNIKNLELIKTKKVENLIVESKCLEQLDYSDELFILLNNLQCDIERSLRDAENDYRLSINAPKIGEGWINETELYYKIKTEFGQYNVIHHGKPLWIGRQHLDIYIEELNVGIEYMGKQHYEAIDFFGGEESLLKTKERDLRKKQICEENNCILIYANENYLFEEIREIIETHKNFVKSELS
jgi:hypothetical protein